MNKFTFSPTGESVYQRTYSRTKADGSKETWPETVSRVVVGNVGLVPWKDANSAAAESDALFELIESFAIIPAGRHLWSSGVRRRQHLFNCWTSGWDESFPYHFTFSLLRLMEGGGVGSNYSSEFLRRYGSVTHQLNVHIVCRPDHPDYQAMKDAGLLSDTFSPDWDWPLVVEDTREGWAAALADLLDAYMRPDTEHVDRVFDVSNIRPKGAPLKTSGGVASGPEPLAEMLVKVSRIMNFMHGRTVSPLAAMAIDHEVARAAVAGGNRRSARMSQLPWNDPEIFEFIACKKDGDHWTTNISVVVDDDFFKSLKGETTPEEHTLAWEVLYRVAEGMLSNGEPGIWNQSLSQVGEVGKVYSTNPCGEITLEPWEPCNLGHINLAAFVEDAMFNYEEAERAARLMTRFLIRATFADVNDPKSREVLNRNRRIGVGLLGVQEAVALLGIRYSEAPERPLVKHILRFLRDTIRDEARKYAFALRIPEPVKVTTLAPTGTIAKMPGTSEGGHPIFSRYYIRRIRLSTIKPEEVEMAEKYRKLGYNLVPDPQAANTLVVEIPTKEAVVERVEAAGWPGDIVESADELTFDQLMAFQEMLQTEFADNAVSFTANINPSKYTVEDLVDTLAKRLPKLKGTTVFPERGYELAPYERITQQDYEDWVKATGLENVEDGTDEDCASGACPIR